VRVVAGEPITPCYISVSNAGNWQMYAVTSTKKEQGHDSAR
jgi:hypothetical protein